MAQTVKTIVKTQNGASAGAYGNSKVTGIELFELAYSHDL